MHDPLQAGDIVPVTRTGPTLGDGKVGFLSYGSQLRAYFGRFFPELFGPCALGTSVCYGPAWHGDPWGPQQAVPSRTERDGSAPDDITLVRLLKAPGDEPAQGAAGAGVPAKPAWVNLWRRTDVLGFPVDSYGTSDIDRGAEEVDRGSYLFRAPGHEAYWRAIAYDRGFDDVVSRLAPQR